MRRLAAHLANGKHQANIPAPASAADRVSSVVAQLGGLDLTGKAAVLKTAGRKPVQVRVLCPPFSRQDGRSPSNAHADHHTPHVRCALCRPLGVTVRYDPADPAAAVLEPRTPGRSLLWVVGVLFTVGLGRAFMTSRQDAVDEPSEGGGLIRTP